ncbi:DUF3105 domain-containing protein [Micromonospora coxensis]|uniref:DUF3105 domain-containing protein n=1 Tax=Micromonospora coxensis TaxID=356852 RepID=UPI0034374092
MSRDPSRRLWRAGLLLLTTAVVAAVLPGRWQFLTGAVAGSAPTAQPPCPQGQTIPVMDSPHISDAVGNVSYNSVPPTSGPHYSFTVTAGSYDDPVPAGLAVHALEHGHVVINHAPHVRPEVLSDMRRLVAARSHQVLIAPYPGLPGDMALTSWGCLLVLPRYEPDTVLSFVEQTSGRYEHGWRTVASVRTIGRPGSGARVAGVLTAATAPTRHAVQEQHAWVVAGPPQRRATPDRDVAPRDRPRR